MQRRCLVWNCELALVLGAFAAGCDDAASPVHVVDVDDGTYLRGLQVSKLEIEPDHEVVRSELYLDGLRVAADDLAPFELAWDTRSFDDGRHTLVARIYLADSSHLDGKTAMWIDNTPPQLGALPASAMRGTSFTVPATDNLKLARVEISRGVEGEAPVVVTAEPFMFSWPWACGTTAIHVRAFDAAGSEVTADASVVGADPDDRDCDGFRAQSRGGNDCDDDDFSAHPGAVEVPEGYDLDCDGQVASRPGIDFDGDGVPSIADGGGDCDDGNPAIHAPNYSFQHAQITHDGAPVTWSPGEAALDGYGSAWTLSLNRGGVIEQYHLDPVDGLVHRTQLATGANTGSINSYSPEIVLFGSGSQIEILQNVNDHWSPYATIPASGAVGKLAFAHTDDGDHVAFQVGTELWLAQSSSSGWKVERIANLGEPIQVIRNPNSYRGAFSVEVKTSRSDWYYNREAPGAAFTRYEAFHDMLLTTLFVTTVNGVNQGISVVAKDDGGGSALYNQTTSIELFRSPHKIAALIALDGRAALIAYRDSLVPPEIVVLNANATRAHAIQSLSNMQGLELTPWSSANSFRFISQGVVHYLASQINAAQDPANDGVDRDCDKLD